LKLSTKSRYGTRLILDMAQHHNEGAIQLSDIAKRQDVSQKYLEQIIIPLKKANYLKGIRGAKGGYILNKHPREITVGEIVALLEGGTALCECSGNSTSCERADTCLTRNVWIEAAQAMFKTLNSITFSDIIKEGKLK
jgi:Rrf2 family iron-sulfur cluster assembly transcriptional regulator